MKWASAISENANLTAALTECAGSIRGQLGEAPQLAVAFVSPHYQPDYGSVGPMLSELLGSEHTFGCSGGGIIGAGLGGGATARAVHHRRNVAGSGH